MNTEKKYEFTGKIKTFDCKILKQIKAIKL